VDDESLFAQWISLAPGQKTPRRMNGDTREWWIVQSGTLRFTVEGREPVVATKGVMVQVPYRTLYQIENVGTEPALRFEVNVTRARKLYPVDETPAPLPGFEFVKTRVDGGRGQLDAQNRPVVDFNKVVSGEERGGAFVTDDRSFANIIIGNYQRPQPGNKGHYHEEGGEFWLVMLGHVRYNIEGLQEFEAEEGDVVYVPRQTWHLASFGGKEGERSCRLAMNGFPYQAHMYEAD
jgi:mannose-6-phosphate isomerase-like protein (cupin superfamily)